MLFNTSLGIWGHILNILSFFLEIGSKIWILEFLPFFTIMERMASQTRAFNYERFWDQIDHCVASHFQISSFSEFQKPSQSAAELCEAKLLIINLKTTWSEFQKPSQIVAEQGEAELRILYFKTTWSEFQKLSQTSAKRGKAELCILDFKTTLSEFQKLKQKLLQTAFHSSPFGSRIEYT